MPDNRKRPAASSRSGTRAKPATPKKAASRGKPAAKRHHWIRNSIIAVVALAGLGVAGFAILVARTTVPTPNDLATQQATVVYWSDGTTEIGRLGDATRRSIPLSEVPITVQHAVLAAEDRSFYDHGGISPVGVGRALWNNVTGGSTQGGSTITQQYAKNAFLSQERSWSRKVQEALLAFKLETVTSKDTILEDYLNTIYFGRGAYGIEAASIAYFGIPARQLTVSQGAVLASIINSPSGLAPETNLGGLQGRWNYTLDGMVQQGWLDPAARAALTFPRIKKLKQQDRLGGETGYLLTMVQDQLRAEGFDDSQIQNGGLRITTTFDLQAERAATAAVKKYGPSSSTKGLRIGLAAVRPGTGEVVAVYGGEDFVTDQINNATRPFAQAGSTFKPFALAAATEKEVPLTSVWNGNSPSTVNGYTFNNYGDHSYGEVTLLQATENSINSAYVSLESSIGVKSVANAAVRAGIPATTPGMDLKALNLTFVLGTASPSGLDMANAYATFAARGTKAETTSVIKEVVGPNDGLLYQYSPRTAPAFDPGVADTVSYALGKVVTNGTGFAAQALGRPAAAKTGTTDGNKSAWFVGYTPQLAAAVLMAKEDAAGLPVSLSGTGGLATVTGGSFPAAMWTAFMKAALEGQPSLTFPPPPAAALKAMDCPAAITPGVAVPAGCPTPSVVTEFSPNPTATLPTDIATPPSVVPTPSPDGPTDTPIPTPAPTDAASGPPTQEGRP